MVTSSRTVRACSATASASSGVLVEDLGGVAHDDGVTTGSACAPIAATVAMSPARPPAPLGSLALKHITQAGGGGSVPAASSGASGERWVRAVIGGHRGPEAARCLAVGRRKTSSKL
jgi:hypothetical protein